MSLHVKLALVAVLVAAGTGYLAFLGAAANWSYYVLVDECVEHQSELEGHRVRVSGRVAPESLSIREDRRQATFILCGLAQRIEVSCPGPLPDNLTEDMEVVVEGTLQCGRGLHLQGEKVLTKCASKYEAAGAT